MVNYSEAAACDSRSESACSTLTTATSTKAMSVSSTSSKGTKPKWKNMKGRKKPPSSSVYKTPGGEATFGWPRALGAGAVHLPCKQFWTEEGCEFGSACTRAHIPRPAKYVCPPVASSKSEKVGVCSDYQRGYCAYGDTCKYKHVPVEKVDEPCRDFQRFGECSWGLRCKFQHVKATKTSASKKKTTAATSSKKTATTSFKPSGTKKWTKSRKMKSETSYCMQFTRTGQCPNGEQCRWKHDKAACNWSQPCVEYQRLGYCTVKGCRLEHVRKHEFCAAFKKGRTCRFGSSCSLAHVRLGNNADGKLIIAEWETTANWCNKDWRKNHKANSASKKKTTAATSSTKTATTSFKPSGTKKWTAGDLVHFLRIRARDAAPSVSTRSVTPSVIGSVSTNAEAQQARVAELEAKNVRLEAEKARLVAEQAQRAEQTRIEAERQAAERAEQARIAGERQAAERAEQARLEAARQAAERAEQARLEAERQAAERAEQARLEAARQAAERAEQARLEAERQAAERAEQARVEAERQAAKVAEQARLEAERLAAQRKAAEAQTMAEALERKRAAVAAQQAAEERSRILAQQQAELEFRATQAVREREEQRKREQQSRKQLLADIKSSLGRIQDARFREHLAAQRVMWANATMNVEDLQKWASDLKGSAEKTEEVAREMEARAQPPACLDTLFNPNMKNMKSAFPLQ